MVELRQRQNVGDLSEIAYSFGCCSNARVARQDDLVDDAGTKDDEHHHTGEFSGCLADDLPEERRGVLSMSESGTTYE